MYVLSEGLESKWRFEFEKYQDFRRELEYIVQELNEILMKKRLKDLYNIQKRLYNLKFYIFILK